MIIAIDFDETIHDCPRWPLIGNPLPHCVEIIQKLKNEGNVIIIWTCREGEYFEDMIRWLKRIGIPFDYVNEHAENNFPYQSRKIFADVYIDDKNLGGLPSWTEIYDIISGKVKPYWIYKMLK